MNVDSHSHRANALRFISGFGWNTRKDAGEQNSSHALGIKSRLKPPKTAKTGKPRGRTPQNQVFNIRYEQCIF